jgi:hypothetical protein
VGSPTPRPAGTLANAAPGAVASANPSATASAPAGAQPGTTARPNPAGTASQAVRATPKPGPTPTLAAAPPRNALALAPQSGPSPAPNANSGALEKLNSRLNGELPSGDTAYSQRLYVNQIDQALQEAQAEYFKRAAPPQGILDRALYIVRRKGSLLGPPTILYVLKKERILGFEICTGWKIEQPPGGGEPQGGYYAGPCEGEAFTPPAGMPTLTPKTPATPAPLAT